MPLKGFTWGIFLTVCMNIYGFLKVCVTGQWVHSSFNNATHTQPMIEYCSWSSTVYHAHH